jgi:uncharacterized protein (DUF4415 family)
MPRKISKRDFEAKREPEVFDHDNPEWTKEDFDRAQAPQDVLPESALKAFPKTRGPQVASKKIPVSIRLSPEVVERFKADGPGWQSRIDDVLKKAIGL